MALRRVTTIVGVAAATTFVGPLWGAPPAPPAASAAASDGGAEPESALTAEAEQAAEEAKKLEAFVASLELHSGDITLGDNLAVLHVPPSFKFTGAEGSERVLQAWGNPPGTHALGMLFPSDMSPVDEDSWGVVVSYEEEGHVDDDDAEDLDFNDLLEQMQEQTEASNEERKKGGFAEVHLLGWAEPPHYDSTAKKVYWAKELNFAGNTEHTLNYAIRVLGRKGVLEFNAVSEMKKLPDIRNKMKHVLAFAEFKDGNRYSDFNPDLDTVAAYGIGGLIAGKIALKVGLFKGLIALLLASKKLVIVGVIALGVGAKALWSRFRGQGANEGTS